MVKWLNLIGHSVSLFLFNDNEMLLRDATD